MGNTIPVDLERQRRNKMGRPINKRNLGDTAGAGSQIAVAADVDGNGSAAGYIVAQKGSKRFKVYTGAGTEVCALVAEIPTAAKKFSISATDSAGGTYFVSKISGRTATLVQNTGTQFANNSKVAWNRSVAVLDESVIIDAL